jgi:hypothetical protein
MFQHDLLDLRASESKVSEKDSFWYSDKPELFGIKLTQVNDELKVDTKTKEEGGVIYVGTAGRRILFLFYFFCL